MIDETKKYIVTILGQTYTIVSDEPEASLMQAAALVDSSMKEIADKAQKMDNQKVAVLVALKCASKLIQLEQTIQRLSQQELALISAIDEKIQSLL